MKIILPDETVYVVEDTTSPPPINIPDSLSYIPRGLKFNQTSPFWIASKLRDNIFEDRDTALAETNEVFPLRPVEIVDGVYKVSAQGKIICRWDIIYEWMLWAIELIGYRNAELLAQPGDGTMDTNDPGTLIDGSDALKAMAPLFAGNCIKIKEMFTQAGSRWAIVDTFNYYNPPTKNADGDWVIGDEVYSYETHPERFWGRTNRTRTNIITTLTATGINSKTDGGIQGGKGDEFLPIVSNKIAAIREADISYYEKPPVDMTIYKNSLYVDGNYVKQDGGLKVTLVELIFSGSTTYGVTSDGDIYILEEMEITANPDTREPGSMFDYRCYASLDGVKPWRERREPRHPVCGWQRKDFAVMAMPVLDKRPTWKKIAGWVLKFGHKFLSKINVLM